MKKMIQKILIIFIFMLTVSSHDVLRCEGRDDCVKNFKTYLNLQSEVFVLYSNSNPEYFVSTFDTQPGFATFLKGKVKQTRNINYISKKRSC